VSAVEGKRGKQLCQGSSSPRRKKIELWTPYKDRPARYLGLCLGTGLCLGLGIGLGLVNVIEDWPVLLFSLLH